MLQNNRVTCFSIVLVMLSAIFCKGQTLSSKTEGKSFYFAFDAGYAFTGFGMSNAFGVDNTVTNGPNNNRYYGMPMHGSLAKGFDAGFRLGYKLNNFLGLELGLSSLVRSSYQYNANMIDPAGLHTAFGENYHVTLLRFCPALKLEFADNRFHPYTRTGLILGIPLFARHQFVYTTADTVEYQTFALTGRLSWGVLAAIGGRYNLNERISLSAELTGILESWAPAKATMISDVKNGNDQLWQQSTRAKEIIYESSYTNNNAAPTSSVDFNQPTHTSKNYLPFSSLEIIVGLQIKLGK